MKTDDDEPASTKLPRPRTGEGWGEGTPDRQLQPTTARARALRRASTDAERLLWGRLRNRQLAGIKFRRQRPIGPFYLDFYAEVPRLAVEVDGSQHYTPDGQAANAARSRYLRARGIRVLRFTNVDVLTQLEGVLLRIVDAVAKGSSDGEVPSPQPSPVRGRGSPVPRAST